MKRTEAIEQLQNCIDLIKQDGKDYLDERDIPLLDMAIEALSKPNYESDNEVRLAVTNRKKEKVILWDAFGEVEYYPTTQQTAKPQGEWVKTVDGNGWNEWWVFKCPFCGAVIEDKQYRSWEYNFCPNCGREMKGANDEID